MLYHFAKHKDGSITYSSLPILEDKADTFVFDLTEDQLQKFRDGTHDFVIDGGVLKLEPCDRHLEMKKESERISTLQKEREQLQNDLKNGKKSIEEISKILSDLI